MNSRLSLVVVLLVVVLSSTAAVAPAAAQSETVDDATNAVDNAVSGENDDEDTNETQLLYQFDGGGALRSVEYREGSTWVTLAATDGSQQFAVAEGDLQSTGSFEYMTVDVDSGETRTVELPVTRSSVVVTTTQDGFYYDGSSGPPVVLGQPTDSLLQISGISGILGSILGLAISAGQIKRRHKNTYKELFSDERQKIERDAFEGWRDRAAAWLKDRGDSKLSTAAGIALLVYVGAVLVGQAPAPGELWVNLSDSQRLIVAGTTAATLAAIAPMYYLADRLYNPNRDFVLDLDSQDVYRAESGDKSGNVAAYSAPPERVSEMEVDGGVTTIGTPGGRAHLVRGFDPEENEAAGNPPELADDREASIEVTKIDNNREILTDLALIGKDLIGAMSAFRVSADTNAMRDIDSGLRNTVSAGDDSMEDVLQEAVSGTRYEGSYNPEKPLSGDSDDEEPDSSPSDPKGDDGENGETADEVTNSKGGNEQ